MFLLWKENITVSDIFIFPNRRVQNVGFGVDVNVGVGVTLSCLHNILWTSGWIPTKFSWIYNLIITKNWLDFGDPDLIFKVTAVEKLKIHGMGTSVCSENIVSSFSHSLLNIAWAEAQHFLHHYENTLIQIYRKFHLEKQKKKKKKFG